MGRMGRMVEMGGSSAAEPVTIGLVCEGLREVRLCETVCEFVGQPCANPLRTSRAHCLARPRAAGRRESEQN